MKKNKTRGRKKNDTKRKDKLREEAIENLTPEQLKRLVNQLLKAKEEFLDKKKKDENVKKMREYISVKEIANLLGIHRTTLYKKRKPKKYKLDKITNLIEEVFKSNKKRYGRRRMSIVLRDDFNINICPRTLGYHMNRNKLICKIRVAKKKREDKNTESEYIDLIQRNFNPEKDNILATDVTYIPADEIHNHVYLSAVISHKTKLIESFEISNYNNTQLVYETLDKIISREDLIVHSDHGAQYTTDVIVNVAKEKKYRISQSRVGNSLDNREIEYFFSILKSECLNHEKTYAMKLPEIKKIVIEFIEWYNFKRINGSLG